MLRPKNKKDIEKDTYITTIYGKYKLYRRIISKPKRNPSVLPNSSQPGSKFIYCFIFISWAIFILSLYYLA